MPDYEMISPPDESDRAPRGVCEITIQIITSRASDIHGRFESLIHEHVNQNFEVTAYEMENGGAGGRLVIYTGTDRLGMEEVRDIAELYSMASGYEDGNIPPNMSMMVAQDELDNENAMLWLEFKLTREMELDDVRELLESDIGKVDLTPKHPEGSSLKAMQFRERNYVYDTVREVVSAGNAINDNLPAEYIQLVCEDI